jgi:hypothetical protein
MAARKAAMEEVLDEDVQKAGAILISL